MRIPHIPKIDWDPIFKLFEKLLVVYKLIEACETMFNFFGDIKKLLTDVKTKLDTLEEKVETLFGHVKVDVVDTVKAPVEAVEGAVTEVKAADAVEAKSE